MMLIALPIFFPLIVKLGYDPIGFGVLVTSVVEIGLITPPVEMNLFVIVSLAERMKFETVAMGVLPFLAADFTRLVLLISFPILSLFLLKLLMGRWPRGACASPKGPRQSVILRRARDHTGPNLTSNPMSRRDLGQHLFIHGA